MKRALSKVPLHLPDSLQRALTPYIFIWVHISKFSDQHHLITPLHYSSFHLSMLYVYNKVIATLQFEIHVHLFIYLLNKFSLIVHKMLGTALDV